MDAEIERLELGSLCYLRDLPAPEIARDKSVLLLHGFPDTPASFAGVGRSLADQGYHVYRPYLPGYAPSQCGEGITIAGACELLADFVRAMGGRDWYLVGHDWGAILSYALLVSQPTQFVRAATLSVPHLAHLLPRALRDLSQMRRSLYILFFQLPMLPERTMGRKRQLIAALCQRWSPGFVFPADWIGETLTCLQGSGSAPFDYYRNLASAWLGSSLLRSPIDTPLLYLHGRMDGCIAASLASGQARYFGAEFESELLECGHFPQLEAPDEVAAQLSRWFAA